MQSFQYCTDYKSGTEKNTLHLVCITDATNNMYAYYYKHYGITRMKKADYYNVSNYFKNYMGNHNYDFRRNQNIPNFPLQRPPFSSRPIFQCIMILEIPTQKIQGKAPLISPQAL